MADKRITELTEKQSAESGDYLIVDNGASGTKKMTPANLMSSNKYKVMSLQSEQPLVNDGNGKFYVNFSIQIEQSTYTTTVICAMGELIPVALTQDDCIIYLGLSEFIYSEEDIEYFTAIYALPDFMQITSIQVTSITQFSYDSATVNSLLGGKEDVATIKTATLVAGATSVTFTGVPTTGNNTIDVYTSKAGLDYTAVDDTTAGTLVYTFEAQSSAVTVYLVIREVG